MERRREGEEKKGKGRDRKGRSGFNPWKKIPLGTGSSIYYYIGS